MKYYVKIIWPVFLLVLWGCQSPRQNPKQEANAFLTFYDSLYQPLYYVAAKAEWKASTDVTPEHTGLRIGANDAFAVFIGNPVIIRKTQALLADSVSLDDLTVRQLKEILLAAASYPGIIPDIVAQRVAAEAKQSALLDGFEYCLEPGTWGCQKTITPNQIDEILATSRDLNERKHVWEVSKQVGPALKPGLIELRKLRNEVARAMGFNSFFDLQVADYGMSVGEMMQLMQETLEQTRPLYEQLHTYTKYVLAKRYGREVPKMIPAHWLGNRWSQAWPGIVEGVDLDPLFKSKSAEWIVQQAERFYTSLGFPELPASFWEKSDLYQLPPGSTRKKNTHASAWHLDLDKDVRSLMSVVPNYRWFETTHHELGHIYYYLAYSNPSVPLLLRGGANRAFHEAVGDLISIAARQIPYLREIGILPPDMKIDRTQWLLNEALDNAVVFMPWSAGVMSHWERDLYEENLSPDKFNQRWWKYVEKFQGVEPPEPRGEEFCDPATKTHINDDPAQYYDYALAYLIKYQLHMYIAKNILKQDPHNCNYYGNREVGTWLWDLLKLGKTKDWRTVIREKTGEDISPKAMLEYFQPVMDYLQEVNKGRTIGWE
ncbi:MAG: M2 family metallopeptidase [Chlorobi bacterium]|nr:M2 family metallopeptidase [Chlorobiota bacterium]